MIDLDGVQVLFNISMNRENIDERGLFYRVLAVLGFLFD